MTTTGTKLQVYDSHGHSLTLADKLKQGGEGAVYDVQGQSDLVAKIYRATLDSQKAQKLDLMVRLRSDRLLKLAAWPIDTLFDKPKGRMVGFLMQKVIGYEDVHILYGVKSRLAQFPEARWPFLIQTASNIARAFKVVHEQNHVIGDINHGSVGVSKKATVTLFDCDSFQITTHGRQYLCAVGIDTHTPPELQGRSLQGIVRSANHDAFGLAVIIFQLLFLGRHPFAGKFLGAKETPPLQKLISEYRFAYGASAKSRLMEQPTGTIPLDAVSAPAATLFERAFGPSGIRPTPDAWIEALNGLASNLKQCVANAGHYYLRNLPGCPWCRVEGLSGVLVFTPVYAVGVSQDGKFSLAWVWAQIDAVPAPGALPSLPERSALNLTRSSDASKISRWQFVRSLLTASAFLGGATILFLLPITISATAWLIVIVGLIAVVVAASGNKEARQKFENTKLEKAHRWREVEQRWSAQASSAVFDEKRRHLEARKSEYAGLPALRLKKLNELERNLRQRQLQKFLDRHRIAMAGISGIGPSRQATLRSFGIETAADIDARSLWQVPGFGPVYTSKLLGWRNSIEQRFVFNPALGVDPADKNAVEKEITGTHATIERELQNGASQLRQISHQIVNARTTMRPLLEASLKELAQAELDAGTPGSRILRVAPVLVAIVASLVAMVPFKARYGSFTRPAQPNQTLTTSRPPETRVTTPTPSLEQQREEAQHRLAEGVELTKTRHYQEAVDAYKAAINLNPELFEAHHELAFALYKIGKYKESILESQQAIKLRADNADTYRNLGLAYSALQKWKEAIGAFSQALKIAPQDATAYFQLGLVYKNDDDLDAAVDALRKAVQLKADFAAAHYELGLVYVLLDEVELATEQYQVLTEINPKLADKLAKNIPTPTPEQE